MREKPTKATIIQFIIYVRYLLHVSALYLHPEGAFLLPSEISHIATHHATRHNTPTHNIVSTALQLSISQKALGMLLEDGNVMPKHVADTIHN
jgi:hypothetical protein